MLRALLFAENTSEARRIACDLEENPDWELVALCSTVADLNFVLDHVMVDLVLGLFTSHTRDSVLRAVSMRARRYHLAAWFRSSRRRRGEWCPAWRTARDIMGAEAYGRLDGNERSASIPNLYKAIDTAG